MFLWEKAFTVPIGNVLLHMLLQDTLVGQAQMIMKADNGWVKKTVMEPVLPTVHNPKPIAFCTLFDLTQALTVNWLLFAFYPLYQPSLLKQHISLSCLTAKCKDFLYLSNL